MRTARVAACALLALVAAGAVNAGRASASMLLENNFALSSHQAGGHPDAQISYAVTEASGETLKSVAFAPLVGFALEPASVPFCANATFDDGECAPGAQLGVVTVRGEHEGNSNYLFGTAPLYNLTPLPNQFARVGFLIPTLEEPVVAVGLLQAAPQPPAPQGGELMPYQLRLSWDQLPQASPLSVAKMSIWGVPADPAHDEERFPQGSTGCPGSETASCNAPTSSNQPEAPFTLNAIYCEPGAPVSNWDVYHSFSTYQGYEKEFINIQFTQGGCKALTFNPSLTAAPTTSAGYSAAGLNLEVKDPQTQSPSTLSASELRSAIVTARGLVFDPTLSEHPVCEDSTAAITDNRVSACPPSSMIGTATLDVKGLSEKISGQIFLGNTEGGKLRIFVVGTAGGLELKLLGLVDRLAPDGLKFTFAALPRLPIAEEDLHFLPNFVRTPVHCGKYAVEGKLIPWEPNLETQEPKPSYSVSTGPNGSPCIGVPASVAVQLEPPSIAADGSSQSTVTVAVRDAGGHGVPADEVELSSGDPSQKIGEVVDNGDGTYSAVVTGSTTVGTSTITATDASAIPPISGSADLVQAVESPLTPTPVTPPAKVTPPPAPTSTASDACKEARARVKRLRNLRRRAQNNHRPAQVRKLNAAIKRAQAREAAC
jgi:hypothetical protein